MGGARSGGPGIGIVTHSNLANSASARAVARASDDRGAADTEPASRSSAESLEAPSIAVVIPCFDQACFLAEAIESARAQTYRASEILVVDDGSRDGTRDIALSYRDVRYVAQEHGGLAAARNRGLRESRATFVVFLDADDRLVPTALASGLRCFRQHPRSAFVSGAHRRFEGDRVSPPIAHAAADDPFRAFLAGDYIGMHGAVMFRRDMLLAVGGYDERLPVCEDYDLYLRVARHYPVAAHADVVAEYRRHGANLSGDNALMLETALRVLLAHARDELHDEHARRAWRRGVRFWKQYYAPRLLREVWTTPVRGGRAAAVRRLRTLLRYSPSPAWWARHVATKTARALKPHLPRSVRRVVDLVRGRRPVGWVRFGDFRRLAPISRVFGYDRGLPVDRYYIEHFLSDHAGDVRGRVLEVGDNAYTRRFGGDRVTKSDVLHVAPGNPSATYVADLTRAGDLPRDAWDCVILTQTLQLIHDVASAVRTIHQVLAPGGVLLATVPGISQIARDERDGWVSHWTFTSWSAERLFGEVFGESRVTVEAHGNVLVAIAFLEGLAAEELRPDELDHVDPLYQVLVTVRAVKAAV